jgi:hypothetical protein
MYGSFEPPLRARLQQRYEPLPRRGARGKSLRADPRRPAKESRAESTLRSGPKSKKSPQSTPLRAALRACRNTGTLRGLRPRACGNEWPFRRLWG